MATIAKPKQELFDLVRATGLKRTKEKLARAGYAGEEALASDPSNVSGLAKMFMMGPRGIRNLARSGVEGAKTAKRIYDMAVQAARNGATPEVVWKESVKALKGTPFVGVDVGYADKIARLEMMDDGLKFRPQRMVEGTRQTASSIMKHPNLYKAYPKLKDIAVRPDSELGAGGYIMPARSRRTSIAANGNIRTIQSQTMTGGGSYANIGIHPDANEMLNTAMHEIAGHGVAANELGMSGGANIATIGRNYSKLINLKYTKKMYMDEARKALKQTDIPFGLAEQLAKNRIAKARNISKEIRQTLDGQPNVSIKKYANAVDEINETTYTRNLGEIDAHGQAARLYLNRAERELARPSAQPIHKEAWVERSARKKNVQGSIAR